MRTLTQGPHSVRSKGSSLYVARPDLSQVSESCMNLSENRVFFLSQSFPRVTMASGQSLLQQTHQG